MKYSCIIALALIWMACGRSGSDVLKPEEMKLVMWDMLRADEVASLEGIKDTVPNNLLRHAVEKYGQVFAVHGITREQFYNSYRYYQEHPEEHKVLMDSLLAFGNRIKEQREKLKTAKIDSLQKATLRADSLAVKKDSAVVKDSTHVRDSVAIKDSINKVKGGMKVVPRLIKDTGTKLHTVQPHFDTSGRRKLMRPGFRPDKKFMPTRTNLPVKKPF
ncbi:hypothetical protein GCM10011379_37340 [Filimonas zeae]|uniref:DUF4296 domain-containing protein n=2 Tax=Filimonas zeae TaxID=1737353 RepID=A0A917J120_9BACT|nr:DUF4296 domain-containing protein [Filimonas zeae]GGH74601.1 hypothetical protein GCM10011379_37340 [Filimonas zeae]